MFNVAFATCEELPDFSDDDKILGGILERNGIKYATIPWNKKQVNWNQFDAVILRSCWDYHLHYPEFIEWLNHLKKSNCCVWNNPAIMKWNADKRYLIDLERKGFLIPDSYFIRKGEKVDLASLMKAKRWNKAVIKPVVSAGAYETWLVDCISTSMYQGKLNALTEERPILVQEYLDEINKEGEWSLVFLKGKFSHAVIKQPGKNDFRVQTEFGGSVQPAIPPPNIINTAMRIIESLPDDSILYARVDGVIRGGKLMLMELELIEPSLFFRHSTGSAERFVNEVHALMEGVRQ